MELSPSARRATERGALVVALLLSSGLDLRGQDSAAGPSIEGVLAQGEAALAAGDPEASIAAFRRAQGMLGLQLLYGERDGSGLERGAAIHRGLAEAYLASGNAYAAAVEAARGVNLDASDARLWTLLGLARHRLADIEGASEALERALAIDPSDAESHWGLALVAIARNRPADARAHGRRAYDRAPRPPYALAVAQWAVVEGDYGDAADALGRYLALAEDDPNADSYRSLRGFYEEVARAPALVIDDRVTRLQLGFQLKAGDEIPYVPVRFNGRDPAYVLFDTGAERNVVDRAYAESIGMGPILPGGPLHGAYRQSPGGYAIADSLSFGSVRVERVPFAVGDFSALHLRGQGDYYIAAVVNPALVFRDFLVILDFGHRRIELVRYDRGGEAYVARRTRLRRTTTPFWFDANGVWPVIRASLDGARELPFLVDTGASDLLIARETAAALLLDPDRFLASAAGHTRENLRAILLDGFPGERWGIDLHGILGFPFFRGMRLVFDYRSMTMVLEN